MNRRTVLAALAAPMVVRTSGLLMPVRSIDMPPPVWPGGYLFHQAFRVPLYVPAGMTLKLYAPFRWPDLSGNDWRLVADPAPTAA